MLILFVHGMGRSSLSAWPLLLRLRRAGHETATFNYAVSLESFAKITQRLVGRIGRISRCGAYAVIGHSLGGVLLRAALPRLPPGTVPPQRIFLLGSPQLPSRLALRLGTNPLYRLLTGDCGQLLCSGARMAQIGATAVPLTSIVGVTDAAWLRRLFEGEDNDGILSVSETSAAWVTDQVRVPVIHALLPASRHVAAVICARLQDGAAGKVVDGSTPAAR